MTQGPMPPGWYPNPSGPGTRYWDGTSWTHEYGPPEVPGSPSGPSKSAQPRASDSRPFLDQSWWTQSRVMVIGAAALVLIGMAGSAIAIGMSMSGMTGSGGNDAEADPGPPCPDEVVDMIFDVAASKGWRPDADYDTGCCEIIRQVAEHLPRHEGSSGPATEDQILASTEPNGSLRVTIESWTNGHPDALDAVVDCRDYLVAVGVD
ncbi:DUF2510 domain-containing protein [Nocardioides antri]|uniref:DUF2510 domain-containing protein n=1 Tax=Nocardioides antri TaxID=2607659 RepID=A0A5B1MAL2_9ACTN|nr:DUF2510 domain-containing protein [Nocardioides antri]KAA1428760.1 DUF2510 domain-containing protein [Nocardioides antri]